MINNAQQFANSGNPWVTDKCWDLELRDAGNPRCSTGRRNSAIAYTAKPEKRTLCDFSPIPQTGHVREGVTETARILAIRNRIHSDDEVAQWRERPVYVSNDPPKQTDEEAKRIEDRRKFFMMFEHGSERTRATLIFTHYSEIMSIFGKVPF